MKNKVKNRFRILLAMLMVFTVTIPVMAETAGQRGRRYKTDRDGQTLGTAGEYFFNDASGVYGII